MGRLTKRLLVAWLFILVGLFTLGVVGSAYWEAGKQATWASTPGRITYTAITEHHWTKLLDRRLRRTYWPEIVYEYEVAERRYRGTTIRRDDSGMGTREQATRWLAPYQPGSLVTVFYDPREPTMSALEVQTLGQRTQALFVVGLLEMTVGIMLLWWAHGRQPGR